MTQLEMTWPAPRAEELARATDPETSYRAARAVIDRGQLRAEVELILGVVRAEPGLTYREIHARLAERISEPAEVMRRLSHDLAPLDRVTREELQHGLLRRGPKRSCSVGRAPMTTWWPREERTS